jgi:hypothetical protein
VDNTIVVGHYKPCIVLFVEPIQPITSSEEEAAFKATILKRTADFNSRLFAHEQINSPAQVICVAAGSLPRTTVRGFVHRFHPLVAEHSFSRLVGERKYKVTQLVLFI